MARPLRAGIAEGIFHVTGRRLKRRDIVRDDLDRSRWVDQLGEAAVRRRWGVFAYVLIDNRFHLFVHAPEPDSMREEIAIMRTIVLAHAVMMAATASVFAGGREPGRVAEAARPQENDRATRTRSTGSDTQSWLDDWRAFVARLSTITSKGGAFVSPVNSLFHGRKVTWTGRITEIKRPGRGEKHPVVILAMPPATVSIGPTQEVALSRLTLRPSGSDWKSWRAAAVGDTVRFQTALDKGPFAGAGVLAVLVGVGEYAGKTSAWIQTKGGVCVGVATTRKTKRARRVITTPDKNIMLISNELLDVCPFSRQGRQPITLPVERVRPRQDHIFLLVEVDSEFPPGPGLDMSVFLLRKTDERQAIMKPIGFTSGGRPDSRGLRLYRSEQGAAGDFDGSGRISIMDNPLGRPWQIYFAYMQDAGGNEIQWPGGRARVKLLFEVQQDAKALELVKARKVDIRRKEATDHGEVGSNGGD